MNQIVVVGCLKSDAKIDGNKLYATVVVRKQGTGQYAGKTFSDWFSIESYGRDNDALLPQLREGVMVECSGEAGAKAYQSKKDSKWYASVTIRGMGAIRPLLMPSGDGDRGGGQAPAPAAPRAPAPSPAPAQERQAPADNSDDVPFAILPPLLIPFLNLLT